jgi:CMP/dCMP kinase
MKGFTIAVDGFSSTGKSTLAKAIAKELGLKYVDSGAMYRTVALFGLQKGFIKSDSEIDVQGIIDSLHSIKIQFVYNVNSGKSEIFLNGKEVENDLRSMEVNAVVSVVSSISQVRKAMVREQQRMGAEGSVVMDGRDIGTVVFPNAELKLYMTADPDIRAERRFSELKLKGVDVSKEEVKENLQKRDKQDQERLDSPLLKAKDAIELDNSNLSEKDQLALVLELYKKRKQQLQLN